MRRAIASQSDQAHDMAQSKFNPIHEKLKTQSEELKERITATQKQFEDILAFFVETTKDIKSDEFFGNILKFVKSVENSKAKMAKEAEVAARRARMEARAKEAAAPKVLPQAKNLVELAEHVEIKRKRKESVS